MIDERRADVERDGEWMLHVESLTRPRRSLDQPVFSDVGVANRLQPRDARIFIAAPEQMGEAALQFQIVLHRNLAPDLAHLRDLPMLGLENRIETTLDRKLGQPDGACDALPQPSGHGTLIWM